jgi:hypothetical protein
MKNKTWKELEIQSELFSIEDIRSIGNDTLTCNSCNHRQRHQCNSKVFQYCGIRKSNITDNGLLKIKCKTPSCSLYTPCLLAKKK